MRLVILIAFAISLSACFVVEPSSDYERPTAVSPAKSAQVVVNVGDSKHGEQVFSDNCARCHRTGAGGAPELIGVTGRLTRQKFETVLDEGPSVMPSWKHLPASTRDGLWAFLGSAAPTKIAQDQAGGCGCGGGCGGKGGAAEQGCGGGCGGKGGAAKQGCGGGGCGSHGGDKGGAEGCGGGCGSHGGGKGGGHGAAQGHGHGKKAKGGGCGCGGHG